MFAGKQWRLPPSLLVVVALYLSLAGSYLASVPALAGYDSVGHQNYVNYFRKFQRLPLIDRESVAFSYETAVQPPLYYLAAAVASWGIPYENADLYTNLSRNPYYSGLSHRWSIDLPNAPASFWQSILVARLASLGGGLLAVIATWLWVNALKPAEPWFAAAVASLVGFNSLFLFLSTTITNDAWSVAGAAVPMALIALAVKAPNTSLIRWFLVGCGCGLATLTKYSALLVVFVAITLFFIEYRRVGLRRLIYTSLAISAGGMVTAGFWYLRNVALYHELVPIGRANLIIPSLPLATPLSFDQIVEKLPWLYSIYWGVYLAIYPPQAFYQFWQYFTLLAWFGVAISLFRRASRQQWLSLIGYALLWLVPVFAGVIHWMRTVAYADHARFAMPAAPAIALLVLIGWQQLVPVAWRKALNMTLIGLFAGIALWPVPTLRAEFAIPAPIDRAIQPAEPLQATFLDDLRVVGVTFPAGKTLLPHQPLPIELFFKAEQVIPADYTLFLHLSDGADRLLYQFDGVPAQGRHPTRQWRVGETFIDRYTLASAPPAQDQLATLSLGFYPRNATKQRLPAYQPDGALLGDRLILGKVRVLAALPEIQPMTAPALATWENGIHLLSYTRTSDPNKTSYQIATVWQSTQPLATDYQLFLQLLKEDQLVAQVDQFPAGEQLPTSTWLVNERIAGLYEIAIPPTGWDQLIVGFYAVQSGQRVGLADADAPADFFTLQRQ